MAGDKRDVCLTVRVSEEEMSLVEKRTEELQRRAPIGVVVTTTDVVRSALLRGLNTEDNWK